MKQKNWIYLWVTIIFFASCGQSLYRLQNTDETQDSSTDRAPTFGYDPSCTIDEDDPFEIRIRLDKQEYPCLDAQNKRPLVDLTRNTEWAKKLGPVPAGFKRVANFKHDDEFYIADIPLRALRSMEFQLSWFEAPANLPAAHAQMLVTFNKETPVRLHKQVMRDATRPSAVRTEAQAVESLILSAEGAAEAGKTCELIGGQKGKYALVYTVASAQQRYLEVLHFNPKREIDSFPLLLADRDKMVEYLDLYLNSSFENFENLEARTSSADFSFIKDDESRRAAAESSRRAKFEKATYRTIDRNCSTSLVALLDQSGIAHSRNRLLKAWGNVSFYPPAAAYFLHAQHLLELKNKKKLNLHAEIEEHRAFKLSAFHDDR